MVSLQNKLFNIMDWILLHGYVVIILVVLIIVKDKYDNNTDILEKLKIDQSKKSILIRLEESKAAYIANHKLIVTTTSFSRFYSQTF